MEVRYYLYLVVSFVTILGCMAPNKKNDSVILQHVFGEKNSTMELKIYDSISGFDIVLARQIANRHNSVVIHDRTNDMLIRIIAGRHWPYDEFKYPDTCYSNSIYKSDYTGRQFCVSIDASHSEALFFSDSMNVLISYIEQQNFSMKKVDSIMTELISRFSVLPYYQKDVLLDDNGENTFLVPEIVSNKDSFPSQYWTGSKRIKNSPVFQGVFRFNEKIKFSSTVNISDFTTSAYYSKRKHDGFQVFDDFSKDIGVWIDSLGEGRFYYPLYIVNETAHILEIPVDKNNVVISQEVVQDDKTKHTFIQWVSIEPVPEFIISRAEILVIPPNNFVVFLMPKYGGDYRTRIRARIQIGNNVILSANHSVSLNSALIGEFPER